MNGRAWTTAEDRKLRKLYRTQTAAECAAALDRSVSAVQQRVATLGLAKSAEWIAECTRRRWAEGRHDGSRTACFKPGQAPFNKGRPQAEWMPAESRARIRGDRQQLAPQRLIDAFADLDPTTRQVPT